MGGGTTDRLRFDGRVAVITGAGRGLGRAYAMELAKRGAAVVVNDRGATRDGAGVEGNPAADVVDEIVWSGGRAVADANDISTESGAGALIERATDEFGRLDILINNAGVLKPAEFPELTEDVLRLHLDVHLLGTYYVTRAAWPHLVRNRYGRVVMTASSAIFGDPVVPAYSTAKSAVVGLARSLALTGASSGIRVNTVLPSAQTRMSGGAAKNQTRASKGSDPALAAAVVTCLAHESCPVSGRMYCAGGGRAARVAIVAGLGIAQADLTAEDVLARWTEVDNLDGAFAPASMQAYVRTRQTLIAGAGGASSPL